MCALFDRFRRRTPDTPPWVLPEDEFVRVMERERARAERNRRGFSVVEFDTSSSSPAQIARIIELLKARRRLTDDIGWMRRGTIGVLLTETEAGGAESYLIGVTRMLAEADCTLPARIYAFQGADEGRGTQVPPRRRGETPSSHRRRAQDRKDGGGPDGGASDGMSGADDDGTPADPDRPVGSGCPPPGVADHTGPSGDDAEPVPVPASADPGDGPGADGRWPVHDMHLLFQQPLPRWKRVGDLIGAVVLLAGIWPVMLLVALLVRLTSRGPVIFRQWRAGRGGRPFVFYKFRTMVDGAEERKEDLRSQNEVTGPVFKMRRDPRITPLGRVLRRTSLDELPQLWNVLRGDMTLVGPRPPTLDEVAQYAAWQRRRLDLTGGITGLWQVSGRSEIPFEEWMRMDIRYSRTRSPATDVRILLRTFRAVWSGRGAT